MASLESDVISKLNNSFLFNLKKPSFQQFSTTDVLNIYQFLFRVYDPSWLLKDDKPQAVILKQSQSFLQRMELGHLVSKSEDLVDRRKLCRIFGALMSKLESRFNGSKNLGLAVRKARNQKVKSMPEKSKNPEKNSTGSTGDGEEFSFENEPVDQMVPQKGKEIPRTPEAVQKSDEPVAMNLPLRASPEKADRRASYILHQPASILTEDRAKPIDLGNVAGPRAVFKPILPTKEIPRTPMTATIGDVKEPKNLNFTYEFLPLVSNASTPNLEKNRTAALDSTYVVPVNPEPTAASTADTSLGSDSVFLPGRRTVVLNTVDDTFTVPSQRAAAAEMDSIREPEESPEPSPVKPLRSATPPVDQEASESLELSPETPEPKKTAAKRKVRKFDPDLPDQAKSRAKKRQLIEKVAVAEPQEPAAEQIVEADQHKVTGEEPPTKREVKKPVGRIRKVAATKELEKSPHEMLQQTDVPPEKMANLSADNPKEVVAKHEEAEARQVVEADQQLVTEEEPPSKSEAKKTVSRTRTRKAGAAKETEKSPPPSLQPTDVPPMKTAHQPAENPEEVVAVPEESEARQVVETEVKKPVGRTTARKGEAGKEPENSPPLLQPSETTQKDSVDEPESSNKLATKTRNKREVNNKETAELTTRTRAKVVRDQDPEPTGQLDREDSKAGEELTDENSTPPVTLQSKKVSQRSRGKKDVPEPVVQPIAVDAKSASEGEIVKVNKKPPKQNATPPGQSESIKPAQRSTRKKTDVLEPVQQEAPPKNKTAGKKETAKTNQKQLEENTTPPGASESKKGNQRSTRKKTDVPEPVQQKTKVETVKTTRDQPSENTTPSEPSQSEKPASRSRNKKVTGEPLNEQSVDPETEQRQKNTAEESGATKPTVRSRGQPHPAKEPVSSSTVTESVQLSKDSPKDQQLPFKKQARGRKFVSNDDAKEPSHSMTNEPTNPSTADSGTVPKSGDSPAVPEALPKKPATRGRPKKIAGNDQTKNQPRSATEKEAADSETVPKSVDSSKKPAVRGRPKKTEAVSNAKVEEERKKQEQNEEELEGQTVSAKRKSKNMADVPVDKKKTKTSVKGKESFLPAEVVWTVNNALITMTRRRGFRIASADTPPQAPKTVDGVAAAELEESTVAVVKRSATKGRPQKEETPPTAASVEASEATVVRQRGRPKSTKTPSKSPQETTPAEATPAKKGRKQVEPAEESLPDAPEDHNKTVKSAKKTVQGGKSVESGKLESKKQRGRPRKTAETPIATPQTSAVGQTSIVVRKSRGRPPKKPAEAPVETPEFVNVISGKGSIGESPVEGPKGRRIHLFVGADNSGQQPAPKRGRGKVA